jgi:glycosyltransferase involved in cell wall biosynthesis
MYALPNRWFVGSALWTSREFSRHTGVPEAPVVPNRVELLPRNRASGRVRPVILGDWRTFNKGEETVERLRVRMPHVEFRLLATDYAHRGEVYGAADGYLCLSLSEGGAFSVSDAEAAALPLVTTDVGNYLEYDQAVVIPWQERDDLDRVAAAVEAALSRPRGPSFFDGWTLERWSRAWRDLVETVADSASRPPLLPG